MLLTNPYRNRAGSLSLTIVFMVGMLLLPAGCMQLNSKADHRQHPAIKPHSEILELSYAAADTLSGDLDKKLADRSGAILAASLVNIDNLEESCSLGRLISEQVASRMAYHGYRVLEMKVRQNSVYIKKGEGEFILSREIQQIGATHDGAYVLVGTYTVAKGSIYISLRIVDTEDNTIITGCDYELLRNYQTDSLLSQKR